MNRLASFIEEGQAIIGVCPCCGEIFQVLHARFTFPSRKPGKCLYGEIQARERRVIMEEEKLAVLEERYDAWITRIREAATAKGRSIAKRRLLKIDRVFSARRIDPQDVKVIFNPIEYCVFSGMTAGNVTAIELVSREPDSRLAEQGLKRIATAVKQGDYSFDTLRISDDGGMDVETHS